MRLLVFFDLPQDTSEDRREYRKFRMFLIKKGFIMMQESVYSKLMLNSTVSNSIKNLVRKNVPKHGLLQMLEITEKQFGSIEYLLGQAQTVVVDSDERILYFDGEQEKDDK
jgi:CRISPR-associated protein Cas2